MRGGVLAAGLIVLILGFLLPSFGLFGFLIGFSGLPKLLMVVGLLVAIAGAALPVKKRTEVSPVVVVNQPPPPPQPQTQSFPYASQPTVDVTETLRKLAELKQQGILTEEEFQKKKEEILRRI